MLHFEADKLHLLIMTCHCKGLIFFIRPFEKRDKLWEHLRRAASTGFPLSKSKSFHQVVIKLGDYVGGHNISTKFYNLPNAKSPRHSWIMALELSKNWISGIWWKFLLPKCCHYHLIYHKYDGHILCQFGTLVSISLDVQLETNLYRVVNMP